MNSALSNLTVLGRRRHHHRRSLLAQHQYLDGSGILPAAAADGDSDSFGVEVRPGRILSHRDLSRGPCQGSASTELYVDGARSLG